MFQLCAKNFLGSFFFLNLFSESSSKGFSFQALIKKISPSKQNKVSYLKSNCVHCYFQTAARTKETVLLYYSKQILYFQICSSKNSLCVILCEILMKTNCSDYKGELCPDVRAVQTSSLGNGATGFNGFIANVQNPADLFSSIKFSFFLNVASAVITWVFFFFNKKLYYLTFKENVKFQHSSIVTTL